jgi:sugar phosphate isomerase/epimerase
MLIGYISEGEQIAAECSRAKFVSGVEERHASWSQRVREYLKDDSVALARFRNAQPVLHVHTGLASSVAGHWQRLQGQLAVLVELAKEREQAKPDEVFALKPAAWGLGVDLEAAWRKIRARWRRGRTEPL